MNVDRVPRASAGRADASQSVVAEAADTLFGEFFRLNHARTVRLAHLLTGSASAADDLAQESLARMHSRLADAENPTAYLNGITVNVCRQWHRGRARERDLLERLDPPEAVPPPEIAEILDLVDALPYRQRAVLVLRYWLGLRETEIAPLLDCRPGTVRTLHFRALARLRKELNS